MSGATIREATECEERQDTFEIIYVRLPSMARRVAPIMWLYMNMGLISVYGLIGYTIPDIE